MIDPFLFTMTAVGAVPATSTLEAGHLSIADLFPASTQFLTLQTCLIFASALLLTKTIQRQFSLGKLPLPPGPKGVPVLGFLPYLTKNIHIQLANLKHQFGPIYRLYFGSQLIVVLTEPKTIRKAFKQEAFEGKPDSLLLKTFLDGYGESSHFPGIPKLALFYHHK